MRRLDRNPYLALGGLIHAGLDGIRRQLGPLRSTAYLAVKRSEAAFFARHDAAFECFHHFTKF